MEEWTAHNPVGFQRAGSGESHNVDKPPITS